MTVNIIKLVVGVESVQDLHDRNRSYLVDYHGELAVPVHTRHKPAREKEVLNGGSLYRVVKNRIQCRQRILGFEQYEDPIKGKMTLVMVSAEMIETVKQSHRPFQGWRYFDPAKAPKDVGVFDPDAVTDEIPTDMEDDLRASGLL